jgi:hypothetical protein
VIVIKDEDDKLHCGGSIVSSNRQSHYIEVCAGSHFYGTEYGIWADFGPGDKY